MEVSMKRLAPILLLFSLPLAAQEHKIAVVSMAHAHVWLHLGTILKGDNVRLVGIAETDPNLIARAKRTDVIPQTNEVSRPGIPENLFFSDYRKMIDETKPDIVWAFTETNRHLEVVEYCAPRKIHVMMEKPLAATYRQALAIQRLARKHGIQVFTNYSSAWQASNYAVKAAVDAGVIGPVYRLRAVVGHGGPGDPKKSSFAAWLADPLQNGGGALMDFGCYSVLWSLWLKGRPESVYASANHLKPETYPQVEDNATIILNYKDGVGIFEASWDLPPRPPSGNEVFGRTGSIVMGRDSVELRKGGAQPTGRGMPEPEKLNVDPLPPERAEPIAYMVDRLKAKQPVEGLPSLHLNVGVVEVLEAAKISIKTGRAIKLPLEITQSPNKRGHPEQ
jgi:predicted dehydrogenase